jgi:hypothetical protein
MAKRQTSISKRKKSHSHKTKKRLAVKQAMLAARKARNRRGAKKVK